MSLSGGFAAVDEELNRRGARVEISMNMNISFGCSPKKGGVLFGCDDQDHKTYEVHEEQLMTAKSFEEY